MAFESMKNRLEKLPIVLAGPIVRRVEPRLVTVWLVLRLPGKLTLKISDNPDDLRIDKPQAQSTADTRQLGEKLHIAVLTLQPTNNLGGGRKYYYDVSFKGTIANSGAEQKAFSSLKFGCVPDGSRMLDLGVQSTDQGFPSFLTPPDQIKDLVIAHGSCRRPHGVGWDAMGGLWTLATNAKDQATAEDAWRRPHFLVLTGDQIYADSVATSLLHVLGDAADSLFGGRDPLDGAAAVSRSKNEDIDAALAEGDTKEFTDAPGQRAPLAEISGFTEAYPTDGHLFRFTEYFLMYLFCWSDALWPSVLPGWFDIDPRVNSVTVFSAELENLVRFHQSIPVVRKVLANTATYMVWDDHDITDDWNLTEQWKAAVSASPTGQAAVRNGMAAAVLCQHWGNDPLAFGGAGKWAGALSDIFAYVDSFGPLYGKPVPPIENRKKYDSDAGKLNALFGLTSSNADLFHSNVYIDFRTFELILMDTRTQRSWSKNMIAPNLVDPNKIMDQLQLPDGDRVTILVAGAPLLAHPLLEEIQVGARQFASDEWVTNPANELAWFQKWPKDPGRVALQKDMEGWRFCPECFLALLDGLNMRSTIPRVVFLSGDVHYSYTMRLEYQSRDTTSSLQLALCTSSSLHNQTDVNSWSYGFALELTAYLPIVSPLIIDVKETIWGWTHNSENALPTFAYESEGFFVRRTSFWEPSGPDFRITTQLVPWSKVGISSFEILPLPGPLSKLIREAGQTANINNANSFFGINNFCTVQFTNKNEVVHRLWFQKSSLSLSEIDFGEAKVSFEPTLTKLPQDTKNLPPLYVEKS